MSTVDVTETSVTPPRVSIVIDNFNYAHYLGRAIDSALAQSYPDVEVVVVDDGSTDESREVLAAYGDRIVAVTKANGGQASALNAGFAACTGDVVVFLDSDDELYEHAVTRIVACIRADVAKVHYRLEIIDASGEPLGFTDPPRHRRLAAGAVTDSLAATGRYVTPVMSGNAFARRALAEVMPIPESDFRCSADGYLVTVVPFYGNVAAVEEELGRYRVHGGNQWLSDVVDAAAMRRRLEHDRHRNLALRRHAERFGVAVASDVELRDRAHLMARLASWRLDPALHPVSGERASRLVLLGLRATLADHDLSLLRRLRLCVWFLLVGTLPPQAVTWLVTMMYAPQRRKPWGPVARPRRGAAHATSS